jgi:hypothetical protein
MTTDASLAAIDAAPGGWESGPDAARWRADGGPDRLSARPLEDAAGVRTQFLLWGYALTGDMLETSALICEGHPELVRGPGAWDRTAADLRGQVVAHGDEPYRQVKDFAALPWAAEHVIRGHEAWPGL